MFQEVNFCQVSLFQEINHLASTNQTNYSGDSLADSNSDSEVQKISVEQKFSLI